MQILPYLFLLLFGLSANAASAASTPTTPHRHTPGVQLHSSHYYAPQAAATHPKAPREAQQRSERAMIEPLALFAAALALSATFALFLLGALGYFLLANLIAIFLGIGARIRAKRLKRRGRGWANFAIIWGTLGIAAIFGFALLWTYG